MLPIIHIAAIILPIEWMSLLVCGHNAFKYDDAPKTFFKQDEFEVLRFGGNDSMNVYLRLLYIDRNTALIGGKNVLYNVSLVDLTEFNNKRIVWNPTIAQIDFCKLRGQSENNCHNYIRVAAKINESVLLVCGTYAFKPQCQKYNISLDQATLMQQNIDGTGKCSFDPTHNSTMIFADGHLYSATGSDFSGHDPIIYREPLRTEISDLKQLNEPNFVGSLAYYNHVYFFFREPAVEHINCGKIIFSRVGRVCMNDKGGPSHTYHDRWTTFLKARLNCSVPGEYPFYFNEIEAVSDIIEGEYNGAPDNIIYGIFNTPVNAIRGSAICAFSMRSIIDVFEGSFKEQENMNSNWLPVPNSRVPEPRPGSCVNDSRILPADSVNFVRTHSLMDEAVQPFHSYPIFMKISNLNRLSAIAVDPHVKILNEETVNVLFLGTDDGKVLKVASAVGHNLTGTQAFVIEELEVFANSPIKKLSVIRPENSKSAMLLVISDEKISSIPLQRCHLRISCRDCVALQDPYCYWSVSKKKCLTLQEPDFKNKYHVQNITGGIHKSCSRNDPQYDSNDIYLKDEVRIDKTNCPTCEVCNSIDPCPREESHGDKIALIYVTDTMGLLIGFSVLLTLIVGFVAGYMCSRHFRAVPYANVSNYPNHQLHRLGETSLNSTGGSSFLAPCTNNKAASLNLVINPTKKSNDKNMTADSSTLQKVKKTYI